jgi:hypothetical protein
MEAHGLFALLGRRSCGGESSKHSLNDKDDEGEEPNWPSPPAPNRNGGSWFSPWARPMVPIAV